MTGDALLRADLSSGDAEVVYVYSENNIRDLMQREFGIAKNAPIYIGTGVMSCSKVSCEDSFSYIGNFAAFSQQPKISDAHKCRKCGTCDRKCPMKIKVSKIIQGMDDHLSSPLTAYHSENCIHCGSCTYLLPRI